MRTRVRLPPPPLARITKALRPSLVVGPLCCCGRAGWRVKAIGGSLTRVRQRRATPAARPGLTCGGAFPRRPRSPRGETGWVGTGMVAARVDSRRLHSQEPLRLCDLFGRGAFVLLWACGWRVASGTPRSPACSSPSLPHRLPSSDRGGLRWGLDLPESAGAGTPEPTHFRFPSREASNYGRTVFSPS